MNKVYQALLVDDEYMILEGLKKIIDWQSFDIVIAGTARNGKEALDFVESHPVDIVLTDVTMPLLSGIDFVYEAEKRGYHFKFIVVSGYQEFDYVQKSLQLGAANYLLKPIDKKDLERTLTKLTQELQEEEGHIKTNQFVVNQLLYQWIKGEADMTDLQLQLEKHNRPLQGTEFTVVLMHLSEKLELGDWKQWAKDNSFYYILPNESKKAYVILPSADEHEISLFIDFLEKQLASETVFFIGVPSFSKETVEESYTSVKEMSAADKFYSISEKVTWYTHDKTTKDRMGTQLDAVNKSILSWDVSKIESELKEFSKQLRVNRIPPNSAKQQTYMILTTSYLVFDSLNNAAFKETADRIFSVHTFKELKQLIKEELLPVKALSQNLMYSDATQQVIEIIQKQYQEDLKLKTVAAELHINAMYLGQVFKKDTGKSFSVYLNNYRINLAKELLLRSNEPINYIAYQVGYQNQGYFYKLFKQHLNYSPREYREHFRKELTGRFTTTEE